MVNNNSLALKLPSSHNYLPEINGRLVQPSISQMMIRAFYDHCRAKNLTEKTIRRYGYGLKVLYDFALKKKKELSNITGNEIQEIILDRLNNRKNFPATINGHLLAFSAFYNFCVKDGLMSKQPMKNTRLLKETRQLKKVIHIDEYSKVLNAQDPNTFFGARNQAMLAIAWDCMLRLAEITHVRFEDLQLTLEPEVTVMGKGRKERKLPISDSTAALINHFVTQYRSSLPGTYLFCTIDGRIITERNGYRIFVRAGNKVGIKLRPHLVRHSSATHFHNITDRDTYLISKALGHSCEKTTLLYLHTTAEDIKRAYKQHGKTPFTGINLQNN